MGAGFLEPGENEVFLESTVGLRALSSRARARAPTPARKEKPCSVLTLRSSTFIRRRWSLSHLHPDGTHQRAAFTSAIAFTSPSTSARPMLPMFAMRKLGTVVSLPG